MPGDGCRVLGLHPWQEQLLGSHTHCAPRNRFISSQQEVLQMFSFPWKVYGLLDVFLLFLAVSGFFQHVYLFHPASV